MEILSSLFLRVVAPEHPRMIIGSHKKSSKIQNGDKSLEYSHAEDILSRLEEKG